MYTLLYIVGLSILYRSSLSAGIHLKTTADRISAYNYPVETHEVITPDGYVLQVFRIPYSPKLQNANISRPVVLIQHGFELSSDFFILNGPDNALPYLLVDCGYDVWLGNHRGNTYGRKNLNISIYSREFWDFSWNELGIIDLPATIDYILNLTKQDALHYVGHSQGTTVFFVLLSELPEYNSKFKTSHMLAPIAYQKSTFLIASITASILGRPSLLSNILEGHELLERNSVLNSLAGSACSLSILKPICFAFLAVIGETDYKHLNFTMMPDIFETMPAGASIGQSLHYQQLTQSGFFRKYDHGKEKNEQIYGQSMPPNYKFRNVKTPVNIYYGLSDIVIPLECINILENSIPNLINSVRMPFPEWSHYDFGYALEVKEVLYDKIIKIADHFEKTGEQLKLT